jgi:hypothetical protein
MHTWWSSTFSVAIDAKQKNVFNKTMLGRTKKYLKRERAVCGVGTICEEEHILI